jgi:hypothetical protein
MTTTKQIREELVRIIEVMRNNVEYESNRTKSQLLKDVALTLNNVAVVLRGISDEVENLKQSKHLEETLKNDAYSFLIEKGLFEEFREYVANTRITLNNESNNHNAFIMARFTKRV